MVFDAGLPGAASPAAAGLFAERWAGRKLAEHHFRALPLLEQLYGIRPLTFRHDDGRPEPLLFVPPAAVLEADPVRRHVEAVGDGWLEAEGCRYEGWVYVAAGAWSDELVPGVGVHAKEGAAFVFDGERLPRVRPIGPGRQAVAFSRDAGTTYFSEGTAEHDYAAEHDRLTLGRAAEMGLTGPMRRLAGRRPYAPAGRCSSDSASAPGSAAAAARWDHFGGVVRPAPGGTRAALTGRLSLPSVAASFIMKER